MSTGFLPSPEKDFVQKTLWLHEIKDLHEQRGGAPLVTLCLPGRECRFLDQLLKRRIVNLETVVCIERDKTESLLIRGKLSEYSMKLGRVPTTIIDRSAYDYLIDDTGSAVTRHFDVIDLDVYGTVVNDASDLLRTVGAAVNVQTRANISSWLLLLTTEIASARNGAVFDNLKQVAEKVTDDELGLINQIVPADVIQNDSPVDQLQRVSMAAAIRVVEAAFPSFEAKLRGTPLFYRGSDELGRPGIRALMGAFAFRMIRPKVPLRA